MTFSKGISHCYLTAARLHSEETFATVQEGDVKSLKTLIDFTVIYVN